MNSAIDIVLKWWSSGFKPHPLNAYLLDFYFNKMYLRDTIKNQFHNEMGGKWIYSYVEQVEVKNKKLLITFYTLDSCIHKHHSTELSYFCLAVGVAVVFLQNLNPPNKFFTAFTIKWYILFFLNPLESGPCAVTVIPVAIKIYTQQWIMIMM